MLKKKKNLKIAIYAICKNEAKFVEKWLENMLIILYNKQQPS